ncbi:MAG: DUF2889 domain-containing protein [Pseudomonadota bacterium]
MSLSPAENERELLHTRTVTCHGYGRADGLWDIEGRVVDQKAYAFDNHDRGRVEVGDPLHDMALRLTLDDNLTIKAVEAVTDKSPYSICPTITPNFQRLVGLTIAPGFTRRARRLLGGIEGCTHLLELLGPIGTTAFQTIMPALERKRSGGRKRSAGDRPALLSTCHAYAPDSPVVKRLWPEIAERQQ